MDQVILVPVGAASGDLNGFITFDGAAVDIWNKLSGAPSDLDELTRYLAEEYEQPDDIIRNDIIAFLEDAVAKGVVIEKTA
ncbi:MAG: PqqD family protein [Eubacterium sp.]|nr:PqqD family protein [Eubacterium sp.]